MLGPSAPPAHLPLAESVSRMPAALLAVTALRSMMQDYNWLNQALLQSMGTPPTLWRIDSEIGDLAADQIGDSKRDKDEPGRGG